MDTEQARRVTQKLAALTQPAAEAGDAMHRAAVSAMAAIGRALRHPDRPDCKGQH